jgi:hypothetical protein
MYIYMKEHHLFCEVIYEVLLNFTARIFSENLMISRSLRARTYMSEWMRGYPLKPQVQIRKKMEYKVVLLRFLSARSSPAANSRTLTYSIEQSPSWQANRFAASQ